MERRKDAPRRIGGAVLKIVLWSLVAGLVLSLFDLTPQAILAKLGSTAEAAFDLAVSAVEWSVPYVLLGALIVVPIWLLLAGWRALKGRRR
jgi:hypothetical protein